ncbi:PEP-CTERM sorting domain-containing protein [Roseateles sp. P5_E7]
MQISKMRGAALAIGGWLVAGAVHAAPPLPLQGRDINGAAVAASDASAVFEYDPNLNLTWLRNWNYAAGASSAWDAGTMTWEDAKTWASTLTVGSFSGWSLPTTQVPDATCSQNSFFPGVGYGCTGSPMGYLWHKELGNNYDPSNPNLTIDPGPFVNMQYGWYWSETERTPLGVGWAFSATYGFQNNPPTNISLKNYAVVVRAGDVLSAVPEPMTWALMLMGLGALALLRIRRPG